MPKFLTCCFVDNVRSTLITFKEMFVIYLVELSVVPVGMITQFHNENRSLSLNSGLTPSGGFAPRHSDVGKRSVDLGHISRRRHPGTIAVI